MALPLKSGADLYNNEALRMRLHNLGADPTEVGAGLIYFNTSNGLNTSKKARIYTGDAWKTLAFVEDLDVASNADFIALQEKVALLAGDVDTDAIISNMKEVSAFLEGFAEDASLMDYLNTELGKKLDKTGGTMTGILTLTYNKPIQSSEGNWLVGYDGSYRTLLGNTSRLTKIQSSDTDLVHVKGSNEYYILDSSNVEEYNAGSATKLQTERTIWGQSFDGTGNVDGAFYIGGAYGIFLNSGREGIFLTGEGINWHNSSNLYSKSIVRFNSSGNVTIGGSDSAGTNENNKLFVYGGAVIRAYNEGSTTLGSRISNSLLIGHENFGLQMWANGSGSAFAQVAYTNGTATAFNLCLQPLGGNVLIGTATDNGSGARLQVAGDISIPNNNYISFNNAAKTPLYQLWMTSNDVFFVGRGSVENGHQTVYCGKTIRFSTGDSAWNNSAFIDENGNLHVKGNIIADGEVSAGGAGEEGSASGSGAGAFHTESIAIGATQKTIAHGLGTDDIVISIYEKDATSGLWSMILTDIEITDANNIRVTFGSATTVEHKVVIMGAVA